jgi:hypothetical protein
MRFKLRTEDRRLHSTQPPYSRARRYGWRTSRVFCQYLWGRATFGLRCRMHWRCRAQGCQGPRCRRPGESRRQYGEIHSFFAKRSLLRKKRSAGAWSLRADRVISVFGITRLRATERCGHVARNALKTENATQKRI